jgi:hypothetical protein
MASRIGAISTYRPKIELGERAVTDDLVEFIARSTGLNESGVRQMALEMRDAVLFFLVRGIPVYIEGLGTYTPKIDLDGTLGVGHRADNQIKIGLNVDGKFSANIINKENVGKTSDELVALWNTDHPDDLVDE